MICIFEMPRAFTLFYDSSLITCERVEKGRFAEGVKWEWEVEQ